MCFKGPIADGIFFGNFLYMLSPRKVLVDVQAKRFCSMFSLLERRKIANWG